MDAQAMNSHDGLNCILGMQEPRSGSQKRYLKSARLTRWGLAQGGDRLVQKQMGRWQNGP